MSRQVVGRMVRALDRDGISSSSASIGRSGGIMDRDLGWRADEGPDAARLGDAGPDQWTAGVEAMPRRRLQESRPPGRDRRTILPVASASSGFGAIMTLPMP